MPAGAAGACHAYVTLAPAWPCPFLSRPAPVRCRVVLSPPPVALIFFPRPTLPHPRSAHLVAYHLSTPNFSPGLAHQAPPAVDDNPLCKPR